MQLTEAIEYARELGVLKHYWTDAAVVKIGEIIADMCKDGTEARWLVNEIVREYNEWPGPKALKDTYDAHFIKAQANVFKGWGEKPETLCVRCGDMGTVRPNGARYERCGCTNGRQVEQKYLDYLNSAPAKVGTTVRFAMRQIVGKRVTYKQLTGKETADALES